MRRLLRWLFSALSVLSLLLCVVTVVMWVRSRFREEDVSWASTDDCWGVNSRRSVVSFYHARVTGLDPVNGFRFHFYPGLHGRALPAERGEFGWLREMGRRDWGWGGFGSYARRFRGETDDGIMIPHWSIAVVTAAPVFYIMTMRRNRKQRCRGFCLSCGYDLRASSDRCPECGTVIPPAVVQRLSRPTHKGR